MHESTDVVMDISLLKIVAFTVMILLALPLFTNRDTIISIGDRTGERLDEQRIKATQLLVVFSVSAFMLFSTAIDGLWPLVWTIPVSVGLYKVLLEIKQMRT